MQFEFHPLANLFPLVEGAEFDDLVADVAQRGLHQPIDIYQGKILDGRNRYRAALAAGITIETRHLRYFRAEFSGDPVDYVLSQNLRRRHLNESQRALVGARIANLAPGRPVETAQNCAVSQGAAAGRVNVSRRLVQSAAVVRDKAAAAIVRAVERGKLSISAAAMAVRLRPDQQARVAERAEAGDQNAARTVIKQGRREERERELGAKTFALPDIKAGVILEDFEWHFETRSEAGMDRHAANHYMTAADALSPEAIVARTAERFSVAAPDCVNFMWVPNPHLWIGMQVMALRGFEYKSNYAWGKDKVGSGYWNREKHELLLIGTKGNIPCPAPGTQWDSLVLAARGAHSEKPDTFYEMIESYFPTLPKLELNARRARAGWIGWGNEAPKTKIVDPQTGEIAPSEAA